MFAIFHDEKLGKQGKIKKEWMGDEEVKILWKSLWTEERGQELEKAWEGLNANWKKASREGENERYKVSRSNFWLSEKLKRPPRNAITNPLSLAHAGVITESESSRTVSVTEMFTFTGKMCSTEYGVKAFFIFSEIEFGSPQKEGRQGGFRG